MLNKFFNKKFFLISSYNLYLAILAFILFLSGILGPGFWKIESPNFFNFLNQNTYINASINTEKFNNNSLPLDYLKLNRNFLPSDTILDTDILVPWSKKIISDVEKGLDLPRVFLSQIPIDLEKYEPLRKKQLFISILLPIALRGNEVVMQERKSMKTAFLDNNIKKIKYFSKRYKIKNWKKVNFFNISSAQIIKIKEELLKKINQIPISMMLAQAAIESGWGSSRFAKEGNALFGEWTWKINSGLKPRDNLNAKFSVKSFVNISESVNSYILNLNSHPAYKKMRNHRSLIIKNGKLLSGYQTSNFLDKYSETGLEYVLKVTRMIKNNNFYKFDGIKLQTY